MKIEHIIIAQTFALLAFLVKDLFTKSRSELKEHAKAIQLNTIAMSELKVELMNLKESVKLLPKIEQDVNAAHYKLRKYEKNF